MHTGSSMTGFNNIMMLCHLLPARYQGHVSAALVLGGVDVRGPHLFTVYPHGSTDALPYATMGSGSLNAMAVFENGFRCASCLMHVLGRQ
jgi:20S proteasome subunit beta 2